MTDSSPRNELKRSLRNPASFLRRLTGRVARRITRLISSKTHDRDYEVYQGHILPPRDLRANMSGDSFRSDEFFFQSGIVEARRLAVKLGHTRSSNVVDIGSGLGRLAAGMVWEFGDVQYLGLEANREFVDWCQKHIGGSHSTYRFVHFDVFNELYNPAGILDGNSIQFPVDSNHADIVYVWGVFTNMGPEHVRIYVSEIGRIARPGARVFMTAFVEDDVPDVSFNPQNYGPYQPRLPLQVVRYSKQFLYSAFALHGLTVDEFRYHGATFPYQSEIYLRKTS